MKIISQIFQEIAHHEEERTRTTEFMNNQLRFNIENLFKAIGNNRDKTGFISNEELSCFLERHRCYISHEDSVVLFKYLDFKLDRTIDFEELSCFGLTENDSYKVLEKDQQMGSKKEVEGYFAQILMKEAEFLQKMEREKERIGLDEMDKYEILGLFHTIDKKQKGWINADDIDEFIKTSIGRGRWRMIDGFNVIKRMKDGRRDEPGIGRGQCFSKEFTAWMTPLTPARRERGLEPIPEYQRRLDSGRYDLTERSGSSGGITELRALRGKALRMKEILEETSVNNRNIRYREPIEIFEDPPSSEYRFICKTPEVLNLDSSETRRKYYPKSPPNDGVKKSINFESTAADSKYEDGRFKEKSPNPNISILDFDLILKSEHGYEHNHQNRRDRSLSPRTHQFKSLATPLLDSIKLLEEQKKKLINLHRDFSFPVLYQLIASPDLNIISAEQLRRFLSRSDISQKYTDVLLLLNSFDKSNRGNLTYEELATLVEPFNCPGLRADIYKNDRIISSFDDFDSLTQREIQYLFQGVIEVEKEIIEFWDYLRHELPIFAEKVESPDRLTLEEFKDCFKEYLWHQDDLLLLVYYLRKPVKSKLKQGRVMVSLY